MSDKNEQTSSRARQSSTSARTQRPLQRRGASARILTVVVATAMLALGGLGSSSVAASGRSVALGSGLSGGLRGVSAHSATDAWAVGSFGNPITGATQTLVLHSNGTSWSTVSSPNPGGTTSSNDFSDLNAVSADSATDAWAVGYYGSNGLTGGSKTLVLRWNGTSWNTVASPNPGGTSTNVDNILESVVAISATDAWAVGVYVNATTGADETLVLHWNGTKWSKVASPNPGGTSIGNVNLLSGVSFDSTTDALAVGFYVTPAMHIQQTLALHWNGTKWSKVASPTTGGSSLSSVSADSATDAWAVGSYPNATTEETLALHWNGTKWNKVASPNPGGTSSGDASFLSGVSARSATDASAVGNYTNATTGATETAALHWNGTKWKQVASPNPGGTTSNTDFNYLQGVSADSVTDAWAVGIYTGGTTLVLHWNGTSWTEA
jgi:hypothetical protein